MMRVIKKAGGKISLEQFRKNHPEAVFSGSFPSMALAKALGYTVEIELPTVPIDEERSNAKKRLRQWVDDTLSDILSEYSLIEQSFFAVKAAAASDIVANKTAHPFGLSMLTDEAAQRGVSVNSLAVIVDQKASDFADIQVSVASQRHRAASEIDQSNTEEEIISVLLQAQSQISTILASKGYGT